MTAKELLMRLPEAVDTAAAADTTATVQYEISEPVYHVIEGGEMRTVAGRAERPDLTVTMSDEDLLALFQGRINPAMAFMTGRIRVGGDLDLAQRLLALFDRDKLGALDRGEERG
jgi:putative sterol carrier protein